jgi:monofunctional biosynthetic peptidoglycan transglycosylase
MYRPGYRPDARLSAYDFFRPRWRRPLKIALFVVLGILALPYVLTPLYAVIDPPSTLMLWRTVTGQRVERRIVKLDRVAPALALSVIIAEDGRFCEHYGVDFRGIQAAFADADDIDSMRGGSTLTQQVAKNLFLWGGRSYVRKMLELPLAMWIDLVLSKRRVLEIYLNIAEWGPDGEFGVEAGARRAFNRSARELSPYQAALMAAMLPNPVTRDARRPGPGLRRLAGLYNRRAARSPEAATCLRQNR